MQHRTRLRVVRHCKPASKMICPRTYRDEQSRLTGAHAKSVLRERVEVWRGAVHKIETGIPAVGCLRQPESVHLKVHLHGDGQAVRQQLVLAHHRRVQERRHPAVQCLALEVALLHGIRQQPHSYSTQNASVPKKGCYSVAGNCFE